MNVRIETNKGQWATIRSGIHPGDIGTIVYLHGWLYAKEYGFDHTFEPYVAIPIGEFVINQRDGDQLWIVEQEENTMGSVAIVNQADNTAQLRWLILHPDLRGYGIGKKLLEEALKFCKAFGYKTVSLWTIDFLTAALKLYTSAGFKIKETKTHQIWGRLLTEERYELSLISG